MRGIGNQHEIAICGVAELDWLGIFFYYFSLTRRGVIGGINLEEAIHSLIPLNAGNTVEIRIWLPTVRIPE